MYKGLFKNRKKIQDTYGSLGFVQNLIGRFVNYTLYIVNYDLFPK